MNAVIAALDYAARGWSVFPVSETKRPLTEHGRTDATTDPQQIQTWWCSWPRALASIATGERAGVVAIDIDLDEHQSGFDSLELLDVVVHPHTVTAHTPRGGVHLLFRHPGHHVKTIAGKLGPGIDIRGDGGSLTLPPGPGRRWDPILGLDTPLADFPAWAIVPEPGPIPSSTTSRPSTSVHLSRYGEVALDGAVKRIVTAPAGQQEVTLNQEVFGIGRLAGGGEIPPGMALESLLWAAGQMPSTDRRRPWNRVDLERKVEASFAAGLRQPRMVQHERA